MGDLAATPVSAGGRPHAALIARGEAAALAEARRCWGPGEYHVRGDTQRGCCVHLTVRRGGALLARWRYELDGRIVEDDGRRGARRGEQSAADEEPPVRSGAGDCRC